MFVWEKWGCLLSHIEHTKPMLPTLLLPCVVACSVLEPGRSLTLAEKGGAGAELVVGAAGFLVLATMNPGGDFGKKELSPALSNRFTQVRIREGWGPCGQHATAACMACSAAGCCLSEAHACRLYSISAAL